MQGGLAPLSISIVLAEAHTKPTAPVFPFRASSRPVGVGEGPIAKRTHAVRRTQVQGVKGEEGGGRPTAVVPGQGVAGRGLRWEGQEWAAAAVRQSSLCSPGDSATIRSTHSINLGRERRCAGFGSGHTHMAPTRIMMLQCCGAAVLRCCSCGFLFFPARTLFHAARARSSILGCNRAAGPCIAS